MTYGACWCGRPRRAQLEVAADPADTSRLWHGCDAGHVAGEDTDD